MSSPLFVIFTYVLHYLTTKMVVFYPYVLKIIRIYRGRLKVVNIAIELVEILLYLWL